MDKITLEASSIRNIFVDFIMGKGGFKINPITLESYALERAQKSWETLVKKIELQREQAENSEFEVIDDLPERTGRSAHFSRHPYNGV